jgi:hypothetical protein
LQQREEPPFGRRRESINTKSGKADKAYVSLRENAVKHLDSRLRGNDEVFHVVAESAGFCAPQLEKDKSIRMLFVVCALRNISSSYNGLTNSVYLPLGETMI